MKRLQVVVRPLLCLACGLVTLLSSSTQAEPADQPVWRVGLPDLGMPAVTKPVQLRGLHVDWWVKLGELAGHRIEFHPCEPPACMALLEAGELDFVGPDFWPTQTVDSAHTRPVARSVVRALSVAEFHFADPRVLQGQRVVVAAESEVAAIQHWQPKTLNMLRSRPPVELLQTGAADVVVLRSPLPMNAPESWHDVILWQRWLYIFGDAAPGLDGLIDRLSGSLEAVEDNWLPIVGKRWFLRPDERLRVSAEQAGRLHRQPTIKLGASPWEPLTTQTALGFDGLALRLTAYHVRRAGLAPVFLGTDDWGTVRDRARDETYDGLGFVVTKPKKQSGNLVFSEAMLDLPLVVLSRADAPFWASTDALVGLRVAANADYAELQNVAGLEIEPIADSRTALTRLLRGRVDAWIEYLPIAEHFINRGEHRDVKIAFRVGGPQDMRIALGPAFAEMMPLIDQSIEQAPHVAVQQILHAWTDEQLADTLRRRLFRLFLIFVLLAAGAGYLLYRLRAERRRTRLREQELHDTQASSGIGRIEIRAPWSNVSLIGQTPQLLGLPPHETRQTLRQHLQVFVESDRLDRALQSLIGQQSVKESLELECRDLPGKTFSYELYHVRRGRGAPVIIADVRDVTEQKAQLARESQLEREVLELQKLEAVGQLAAGIAHEFNNNLMVSLGHSELALAHLGEGHPAYDDVQRVIMANEQSKALVGQILDFSRRHQESFAVICLTDIVREALAMLQAGTPADVVVQEHIAPTPLYVFGEKNKLSQVFVNLYTNSLDAIDGRGTILVHLEISQADPKLVQLTVEDSGPGISDALRGRIFDPFFTTKAPGQGSGLGLSIAHGIVRAHTGSIDADNGTWGARVTVSLPLVVPTDTPRADASAQLTTGLPHTAVAQSPLDGMHVWLVDDEPAVRVVLAAMLRSLEVTVQAFDSGQELLKVCPEQTPPDAVITDLSMPGMDGIELRHCLAETFPTVPVVLLTGYSELAVDASGSAFHAMLRKPIRPEDLVSALNQLPRIAHADA
ncbi:MAG: response regulator [Pseudomonadota bacterium]